MYFSNNSYEEVEAEMEYLRDLYEQRLAAGGSVEEAQADYNTAYYQLHK